ncbi:MAG: FHA domain-containing protein [Pirellulaceae bacterium]|nr:FHA domain-containing protein [Pirellulaceae bacterium]
MASFFVIRGPDHGQQFALSGRANTIGRDAGNQIRLHDSEVSRQHAQVTEEADGEFQIADCGSSNGTFVNSVAITSTRLHSGDRVQLGRTLMIFTRDTKAGHEPAIESVEIVAADAGLADQIRDRSVAAPQAALLPSIASDHSSPGQASLAELSYGELLFRVSEAIHRTLDVDELLRTVLALIFQWIQCDRGCIMLQDEETGELTPACTQDRESSLAKRTKSLRISRTIVEHVLLHREGVITSNAQADARWNAAASVAGFGIREAICVPMLGRYGVQGVIYVDTETPSGELPLRSPANRLDSHHLKLLMAIASQAALAIEDTQFYRAMLQTERLAAMGQAIANVSHHVKNILQGISGGSYLVEEGLKHHRFPPVIQGWDIVKKNQQRINNLVLDMLSFSKDRQPELALGDVSQVVTDVMEIMRSRASDLGVALAVHLPEQPLFAHMDSEAIHRALLNLVGNAVDAAAAVEPPRADAPSVTIAVEADRAMRLVKIIVSDNGIGIPADQLARIFQPFYSSKGARGTGLGLPVSLKILREHAGDITVQSQPGLGSSFTMHWPDHQHK